MYFNNIIIIGNGSLLTNCLKHVHSFSPNYLLCVETENNNFSNLKNICHSKNIKHLAFDNKKDISNFFSGISEFSLVLSIHNSYIFNKKALEKNNLKFVNFHNSLLPKHPGRNAPTWAIYEQDKMSGITWHEIVPEIDKGDIIIQKEITLNTEVTGLDLTKQSVNLGFDAFKEIFPSLLNNQYILTKQQTNQKAELHYSYQIPNDGVFNKNWLVPKMSAFLRSLDYGVYPIFPKPTIVTDAVYQIESYQIINSSENIYKSYPDDYSINFEADNLSISIKLSPIKNKHEQDS